MEPAYYSLPVFVGSPVSTVLRFVSADTQDPVDLTGLSPFKWQVRDRSGGPLLVEGTVADTSLVEGIITLVATAEATAGLCPRTAKWDLLDASGLKYLYGPCVISNNITEL